MIGQQLPNCVSDCERQFPEIMLDECRKLRERLLDEGVVMISMSKFAEMLEKAIKERCPSLSLEKIEIKMGYWAERGGVYSRCGIAESLYDEYGEKFGCLAYGYLFLASQYDAYKILLEKGEIRAL
jgi:hypothetical protein